MRPIQPELREKIAANPFMKHCIYKGCNRKPEWEHSFSYGGRDEKGGRGQINEEWAIIPVCAYHHRGKGLDKEYNRYRALMRADLDDLERRMPRFPWRITLNYLKSKFNENGDGDK
jgi:hypothetical protein